MGVIVSSSPVLLAGHYSQECGVQKKKKKRYMRNVQPDVPPIGAAVDVIGFFWNMSLVGNRGPPAMESLPRVCMNTPSSTVQI